MRANDGDRILIVDDIFDRGMTFRAVLDKVNEEMPYQDVTVKMAALYYKPENNEVDMEPDFHYKVFEPGDWIVLPHELEALSPTELGLKGFKIPKK